MRVVPFELGHLNWILNSWLMSGRSGFEFSASNKEDYYGYMEPYIKRVLALPETVCLVAEEPAKNPDDPEDENTYMGYVVASVFHNTDRPGFTTYIHYVYTKQSLRRFGLAKKLIELVTRDATRIRYTTIPNQWKWLYAKQHGWRYDKMYICNRLFGEKAWTQNQISQSAVEESPRPIPLQL